MLKYLQISLNFHPKVLFPLFVHAPSSFSLLFSPSFIFYFFPFYSYLSSSVSFFLSSFLRVFFRSFLSCDIILPLHFLFLCSVLVSSALLFIFLTSTYNLNFLFSLLSFHIYLFIYALIPFLCYCLSIILPTTSLQAHTQQRMDILLQVQPHLIDRKCAPRQHDFP